ncbi:MAG TPA: DUF2171 domain-containing protein [Allosphingosinicella sp.]|nr:DUF2171 domain-containing protein [Allosphingosinicella sp.]
MDNRYGNRDERWRDRDRDSRYQERGSYDRDSGRRQYGGNDDRGFMERAGDEVRSWFGDDEAERRREEDDRRWERERGMTGRRDNQSGRDRDSSAGYRGTSGGWGNQSGESWNRERPGAPGSYGAYGAERESSGRDRREERSGNERGYEERSGAGGGGADTWGGSGFGGLDDNGRRFDRVDAGHVGAQGAHPMSAPVGGGYGGGAGISASGGYSSSAARYAAAERQGGTAGSIGGGGLHDPHYSEWRNRQIESIDRDYDEYRREHQSRFEQDFTNWRTKRGEQRQSMRRVTEHMEVFGSDGEKIGTVEAVHGDRIMLAKNDENAGGHQHSIPCSWIEKVDEKVTVNKSREEAMREWRDEERSRALFEREGQGSSGPHVLNRSFSGTY